MNWTDRFWSKVDRLGSDDCWPWLAYVNADGYGTFNRDRAKPERAHRIAYELVVDRIPDGLQLDHLCRNRACVNPAHLEAVAGRTNVLRGESPIAQTIRAGVCKRGHPRTPENLYVYASGTTRCRPCHREDYHARRAAGKERKGGHHARSR